jgi:MFS family permease
MKKEQGAVLGTTNSLGSIAQIFGPLIGGFSLQNFSPIVLGLIAASFLVLSLIIRLPDYLKIR